MRELDWAVTPSAEGAAGGRGRAENSDAIASTTIIRSTMAKLNIRATSNLPLLLEFDGDPSTRRTACRWAGLLPFRGGRGKRFSLGRRDGCETEAVRP